MLTGARQGRKVDRRSAEAAAYRKLYNTARWQRTRAQQLAAHPLCAMCEATGHWTAATVCDHLDKASKATEEGFFAGPFRSLCKHHHDADAQRAEHGGAGYAADVGADGYPLDPKHLA